MKTIKLFLIVSLVFFALSCAKKDDMDDVSNQTLAFWTVFAGPDGNNMNKLVSDYNATNPVMKVEHIPLQEVDLYGKIATVVTTGEGMPDFGVIHINRVGQFVKNDLLLPLDEFLLENGIKKENYIQTAWNGGTVEGKQYSVPLDIHSFLLYSNTELLEKYAPNVFDDGTLTFQEIMEVGDKAKQDGIVPMGLTWWRVLFLSWYAQLGGKLEVNGAPVFNNEKAIKVLNEMKELADKGYTQQDGEDPGQLFRSGQMIFWPEGSWMINSLKEIDGLNFKTDYLPVFDPPKNIKDWTSSHQIVVYKQKNSKEKMDAILSFVSWLSDNSLEWANAGHVPATLKIKDSPEFGTMPQAFLMEDESALSVNFEPHYGFIVEALDRIIADVTFGRVDAREALEKAEKEVKDRITIE